ncbi:MAG: hypothetical protein COB09_18410 [Thalassobium sp.]|nr:MAG: hypothetical protein COB09_18410 [Thalassobium sp.]
MANPFKVLLGSKGSPVRSSFMFVRELQEDEHGNKKCKTGILLPKSDTATFKKMVKAVNAAGQKKFGSKFNVKTTNKNVPFRDGDKLAKDPDSSVGKEAKGHWVLTAIGYKLPDIQNRKNEKIIDDDEIEETARSGNYFLISVTFKGFEKGGNSGVRTELNNIMYVKEGEALDGSMSGEDEFREHAMDDDEELDEDGMKALFKKAKSADKKAAKKALKETGESSIGEVDEEDYEDLAEALREIVGEEEEDEEEEDDEEEEEEEKPKKKKKKSSDKKSSRRSRR